AVGDACSVQNAILYAHRRRAGAVFVVVNRAAESLAGRASARRTLGAWNHAVATQGAESNADAPVEIEERAAEAVPGRAGYPVHPTAIIAADCGITGKCAVGDGECPAIIENRAAHAAAAAAVKQFFAATTPPAAQVVPPPAPPCGPTLGCPCSLRLAPPPPPPPEPGAAPPLPPIPPPPPPPGVAPVLVPPSPPSPPPPDPRPARLRPPLPP